MADNNGRSWEYDLSLVDLSYLYKTPKIMLRFAGIAYDNPDGHYKHARGNNFFEESSSFNDRR